jgi:hypothetical protein
MQAPTMNPKQILSTANEVVNLILSRTTNWVEALNILNASRASIAGGLKSDLALEEAPKVASVAS